MSFAQTHDPVDIEWIIDFTRIQGNALSRRMGQPVTIANDEAIEDVLRIELGGIC